MSTEIIVPSGLQKSTPSLVRAVKKAGSKPFIGKKVAFLKASVSALAKEVKQKQDELDKVLDQLEDMDKQRDALTTETEMLATQHAEVVMEWEDKIQTEKTLREKETEEAEVIYESTKNELDDNLNALKTEKQAAHENVWAELNKKLAEFQEEALDETKRTAAEKMVVIAQKDGIIDKYEKDKRSVKKMTSLMNASMGRQMS
jgi:chromosome segregation ATPase